MTIESRNTLWIAAGVLAAAFLAGGLAGGAVALALRPENRLHDVRVERVDLPLVPPAPGAPGGAVFYKRLGSEFGQELGLDEEQSARVDSLMAIQRQKADSLLEAMQPRLKALIDSTNASIEALLNDEQRERFRDMEERRHEVIMQRFVVPGSPETFEMRFRTPGEDGE
jgi:hypothetical protein